MGPLCPKANRTELWPVSGPVTLGTTSNFKGVILGKSKIAVNTGAKVNGRLWEQTAVTLQMNTMTAPAQQPV
ncbi:MAG: hypothetical protein ACI9W6_002850 [Motiliproteus sp.]|jgi:hypothetical protein